MKELSDYPGYYITEAGDVYSHRRITPVKLKPMMNHGGYLRVRFNSNHMRSIHRLVAQTFIPNPLNLPTVNHLNEDKTDNRVENLEWASYQHNVEYSHSKYYQIENTEGDIQTIYNLAKWCRDRNINRGNLWRGQIVKGYKLVI